MESKIVYHVDKFVAFLFGKENENDPEQRIYNKLLWLQGEQLELWMNEKLKKYIIFAGYYCDFQGDEFEGIAGPTRFETWYKIHSLKENSDLMRYDEIFNYANRNYRLELYAIKLKLIDFQSPNARNYDHDWDWRLHIMSDYMIMFIMKMNTEDLKSYIIRQVEPA